MKNKIVFLTMLVSVVLLPVGVHAIPFYLTQSNILPDGQIYATVDVTIGTNTAAFVVDANNSILVPAGNFGIDKFFINTDLDLSKSNFILGPLWSLQKNKEASEFGKFEILYKGNGNVRFDPLTFSIAYEGIGIDSFEPNDDGYIFAAHIAGFTYADEAYRGVNSGFFANGATSVPEPATMFLLGTGLIGLAGIGRKKFLKNNT